MPADNPTTTPKDKNDAIKQITDDAKTATTKSGAESDEAMREFVRDLQWLRRNSTDAEWKQNMTELNKILHDQKLLPGLDIVDVDKDGPSDLENSNVTVHRRNDDTTNPDGHHRDNGVQLADDLRGPRPKPAPGTPESEMGAVLKDQGDNLPTAEQLTAAGLWNVRISLESDYIKTPQQWDDFRKKLEAYKAAGITVTMNVPRETVSAEEVNAQLKKDGSKETYDPQKQLSDLPKDSPVFEAYKKVYLQKLAEIQKNLGGSIDQYEIWNEPDAENPKQASNLRPDQFSSIFNAAYEQIKGQNPNAKVIIGGLASGVVENYLAKTDIKKLDGIALHYYGGESQPDLQKKIDGFQNWYRNKYKNGDIPIYLSETDSRDPATLNAQLAVTENDPNVRGAFIFWRSPSEDQVPGMNRRSTHEVVTQRRGRR